MKSKNTLAYQAQKLLRESDSFREALRQLDRSRVLSSQGQALIALGFLLVLTAIVVSLLN